MSSYFLQRMENYQGDLADIIRSTAGGGGGSRGGGNLSGEVPLLHEWQFPADPMNYPSGMEEPGSKFGDPFSNTRDPLLHELDIPSSAFFNNSNNSTSAEGSTSSFSTVGVASDGVVHAHQKILDEDQMKRPCNIFSTMLQISPNDSPILDQSASLGGIIKNSPLVSTDLISTNASKNCLVESTAGVQISSPRNMGIKRRKSQAKKVVCIPAPAPANSRPSGEVVPSDLWAWRKYGQKPIKGSPYPRGYYRCSSSKGCSARKQVERSRTDPNMLVITYTSEHNHPWPTQRNALAGSTRNHPSKNNNSASKNSSAVGSRKGITTSIKEEKDEEEEEEEEEEGEEEEKECNQRTDYNGPYSGSSSTTATTNKNINPPVKEELEDLDKQQMQREMDGDEGEFSTEGFPQCYTLALPDSSNQSEDFFAEFGEMGGDDPLNLLLTQGLIPGDDAEDRDKYNKALDPFSSLFDWTGSSNSSSINTNSNNNLTRRGL